MNKINHFIHIIPALLVPAWDVQNGKISARNLFILIELDTRVSKAFSVCEDIEFVATYVHPQHFIKQFPRPSPSCTWVKQSTFGQTSIGVETHLIIIPGITGFYPDTVKHLITRETSLRLAPSCISAGILRL